MTAQCPGLEQALHYKLHVVSWAQKKHLIKKSIH